MSFDPSQYRCTIIRGKAKSDLDNLLTLYARITEDLTPSPKEDFAMRFNEKLGKFLGTSIRKTLDNHRTEIVGKLFGMYYEDVEGMVHIGERTKIFLDNLDQPFFFKDICYKLQFPNGMDKIQTIRERVEAGISLRPLCYLVTVLQKAQESKLALSLDEIGYYILNAKDVLCGKVNPEEVVAAVFENREKGKHCVVHTPGKASSYDMQHIREQVALLELANLVIVKSNKAVYLNEKEKEAIQAFVEGVSKPLPFDLSHYNLEDRDSVKQMYMEWSQYYSRLSNVAEQRFVTNASALIAPNARTEGMQVLATSGTKQLGDDGENFVYEYEKQRVAKFNPRLAGKVKHVGQQRGLGYDIQSVVAKTGDDSEFVMYLEVKSTKRVTPPDMSKTEWFDQIGVTRNEWVAAQQHGDYYLIYRVYFTSAGVQVFVIKNPFGKSRQELLSATPTQYSVEFGRNAIDSQFVIHS